MEQASGTRITGMSGRRLACGLVDDLRQAQRVAGRLTGQGIAEASLSLLLGEDAASGGSAVGATSLSAGGRLRGPAGWPGAATAVALPGLGACFAAGPILDWLAGRERSSGTEGYGAAGVPSTLRRLGLTWAEALACEQALRYQQVWLGLDTETPETAVTFRRCLIAFGGRPLGPAPKMATADPGPNPARRSPG